MPLTLRKRVLVAAAGVAAGLSLMSVTTAQAAPSQSGQGGRTATNGPCQYTVTPDEPPARPVPLPPDPAHTPDHRKVGVTLTTTQGLIPLTLNQAQAPCTVQSFLHLTKHHFYDFTTCHRLTSYSTLKVLQCGDPTGTGEGGPGYRYKDELPTNLPPAPTDPTGVRKVYARGVLAMANAGPDTNGSQFFLVFADSALRPNYTIFGSVRPLGLQTLDRIAAAGVAADDPGAPLDGAPALTTHIETAH